MSRLKPLNVRRRLVDDDDEYLPILGSRRARLAAQRDYVSLSRELQAEDDVRPSPSYIPPAD